MAISKFNGHDIPESFAIGVEGAGPPNPAVKLWGTGSPRREFLYSDDLADACVLLMEKLGRLFGEPAPREFTASNHLINIGYGQDTTIRALAEQVAGIVGFDGPLDWDATKPDGTPRKFLDSQKINRIGWTPSTPLDQGVRLAYADYLSKITDYSEPKKTI